jgi:hypothetical protein
LNRRSSNGSIGRAAKLIVGNQRTGNQRRSSRPRAELRLGNLAQSRISVLEVPRPLGELASKSELSRCQMALDTRDVIPRLAGSQFE